MKKAKRALALALVFALVASFCVTGAAAVDEPVPGNSDTYVQNGDPVTKDGVIVSKRAEYVSKNEYEITLEVTIPDAQVTVGSSADIVLVIDTSGSMNYCADCGEENYHDSGCSHYWGYGSPVQYDERRLYAAQESAKSFVDQLLDEGEGVNARIGIVSYETTADVACELSKNAYEIEGEIGYLDAYGGTNIQAGIHEARQMLESSPAANKYIVVLSDGEPTYSYPVKGTSDWSGCYEGRRGSHYWNDDGYGWGEPADIKLPSADEVTENDFDYDAEDPTGSGSSYDSSVYALLDATCEHGRTMYDYEYYGEERPFDNNGDPAIAEAGFAKADDCTIYSIYFGTPSDNAEHTMLGISNGEGYYSSAANGNALQGIFDSIAGDVIETSAGAVTDPMGEYITLGDVENLAGVRRTGTGLTWDPRPSQGQQVEGGTKYTVTYPIKVDGEKLTASDWVDANDTTTFTYEVNGEERTAEFNVPKVWGEKVVTPPQGTPQDVYVYVEVVKDDGNEFSEDEIAKLGLAAINEHGYYTIGVVNDVTMPDIATADTSNIYDEYGSGVTTKINNGEISRYAPNAGCDLNKVTWYSLHKVTNGADDYDVTGNCWHLDGRIKISDIEEVTVTYTSGYGNNTMLATYDTIKGAYTPTMSSVPIRNGYTFTGWKKVVNGEPSGNILSSEDIAGTPLTEDTTYVAQWSQNTNEVYIEVYLDGNEVTEDYEDYLSGLTTTGTTSGIGEIEYRDGHVVVPYAYEDIDAADVKFSVNSGYVLQGVSGWFVYGESGWGGVDDEGGPWTVDNVDGDTTLNIYLNTAYKVEYVTPSGTTQDPNTYIVSESVSATSNPTFGNTNDDSPLEERNVGKQGSWKNPDDKIKTEITIATLPTGTNGWYDELDDIDTTADEELHDAGERIPVKDNLNLADGDTTFTFTATANQYKVTYNANATGATGTTADNNTYTHGATVTVLENGFTYAGHTFTGWNTQPDGSGTAYQPNGTFEIEENTTLYAQWTEITGTLTVTKTVEADEGTVTLPERFTITVTGTSGAADDDSYTLTIGVSDDENIEYSYDEAIGAYKWVISGAALGNYSVSESNTQVSGYKLDTSASTQSDTMTLTDTATSDSAELRNVYVKDNPGLGVDKTVYSVNGDTTVPEMVKVDDVIVYQIVVTNTGNVALEKISVTDTLGEETLTVYTDAACTTPATTFGLAVDESKPFYAKYEVTADDAKAGSVKNTATASDGDTTGEGDITVDVKKQYKLIVKYYYDSAETGNEFMPSGVTTTEYTLNEGDGWIVSTETDATHVAPETVEDDEGIQFVLDTELPIASGADGIKTDEVVELVYARDEWEDGTPDYKQAWIVYEVADDSTGMGSVSPESRVVTLTDVADGIYKGTVTAASTATPEDGSVFVEWSWTHDEDGPSTNATLSHEFTAVGGEEYVFTAHFRAGTTSASVDKQLVSYERDGETVSEIPEGFKALVGDVLNYEISVKNTGEVALNTTVTDSITGEGTLTINAGEGYTVEDGKIIISGLAPEGTVTITASYTVVAGDIGKTITNTATADLPGGDDPKDDEEVTVDDYSVTITPADIVAYTGGDGYSAVVGANDQYINNSESGLPEPGYHVVLSDAVVDWLNDNGVAAGDGSESEAANLEDVLSFTYNYDGKAREWSLQYVGVYSYNASGNPSAYVYSIVTETEDAPSVSLKYFDDLNEDGEADDNEVITSDDILMSANQVNRTYKMTIEGGDLDQRQVKAVLEAGESSLTTDIEIGIGELTVLSTTNEETTNSIAGSAAGVDSGVITAVGNDSITYYVNESGVAFDDEDLVSRVQLLIDEVTNETSGEFETAMAEAAFDAISADLRNAEYEMCYMDLVDTENGNAKVTFSGGELSIYWPLPDGASASDSFYIVHFTELDREHAAVGTDVLDTTNKDVIAGEVMRIGGEYYVTFDVGSFSPFVLVYGDEGGGRPIIPVPDPDDGDDEEEEFVPKWLNIDDHYAYIIGYEDGTVRPQGNITRAEVATIFFRLLTDEVREEYWSTESGYSDVSSSDWYNNAISTLSNLGVITGYEDGTFRPNASISRAEFVTIATRFFDYAAEYEGTFSDVSYSSWYADFVQAAVDMGLVNGYENGTFRPNASITRAEAVAIVNRVLLRRPDADHLLPWSVMNTFSDNVLESAWYYEDIQEATNSHDYEWLKSGVEDWTEKLPERDWAALEREWSSAYDAPGGEVTG